MLPPKAGVAGTRPSRFLCTRRRVSFGGGKAESPAQDLPDLFVY
jgi:hypothetical protein